MQGLHARACLAQHSLLTLLTAWRTPASRTAQRTARPSTAAPAVRPRNPPQLQSPMAQAPASKVVPAVAAAAALALGLDAWLRRKFGGPAPRTTTRPWQVATTALWYSWPRVAADPIALNPIRRGTAPAGPGRARARARLARHYLI